MRFADGGDDDVCAAADFCEVARAGVGDGDGGVGFFADEEVGHGFADDHAAPDDDGVFAGGFDAVGFEEFHAAERGAGDEAFVFFKDEFGDVDGVEAVDVFARVDGEDDGFFVDVFRGGALDEDAVDAVVGVELPDEVDELVLGGFGGQGPFLGVDAEFGAGFDFGADVDL